MSPGIRSMTSLMFIMTLISSLESTKNLDKIQHGSKDFLDGFRTEKLSKNCTQLSDMLRTVFWNQGPNPNVVRNNNPNLVRLL